MTYSEPTQTTRATRDVDLTAGSRTTMRTRAWRETKPSPKTTELWFMLAGIAAIAVIYNVAADASLTLFRACLLGTMAGMAYIVSRGIAKAGSHDDRDDLYDDGRRH